jgi:hypothetical protein
MEEKKSIFNSSDYGKALKTILLGVCDDKVTVKTPQSLGGHVWKSDCKMLECKAGRFMITTITKNSEYVGKFVYNMDTDEEIEVVGGC